MTTTTNLFLFQLKWTFSLLFHCFLGIASVMLSHDQKEPIGKFPSISQSENQIPLSYFCLQQQCVYSRGAPEHLAHTHFSEIPIFIRTFSEIYTAYSFRLKEAILSISFAWTRQMVHTITFCHTMLVVCQGSVHATI